MKSADFPSTGIARLKRWWLQVLIVLLLVPALSLQALVSTAPLVLFPCGHQTMSGMAGFDCHAHSENSASTAGGYRQAAPHQHSPAHQNDHGLADGCSCVCCVACPIPMTGPLPLAAGSAPCYTAVAPHFFYHFSDQPQPPPRG